MHENQPTPPLDERGMLHPCHETQWAQLIQAKVTLLESASETDAIIIDGSALINIIRQRISKKYDCCAMPL